MKKKFILALLLSIVFCSPAFASSDYPLVTYDDIMTGEFNGEIVYIDAIVDHCLVSGDDSHCSLWFPTASSIGYVYDGQHSLRDIEANSPECTFLDIKDGDIVRFSTEIYDDGSFGTTTIFSSEIIDSIDIEEVRNTFYENCPTMDYEGVSRDPDNFNNNPFKVSGTVFQIIDEGDYSAAYLIDTDEGYVYASWYDDQEVRGPRFLEGDEVEVYGNFECLRTYSSLLKENTVPGLSVISMILL